MNKALTFVFTFLVMTAIFTRGAYATEGQIKLSPTSGNESVCLTNSVYIDGAYHLLLTCRGLITPYSAEVTRYALWQNSSDGKRWIFLGKLNQGKFDGVAQSKFTELIVTAEQANSPRTPSEFVVARGTVTPFEFDKGTTTTPTVTLNPTATPTPTPTVATGNQTSVISKIAGTILRLLVVAFVIVLIAVVVMTVITRRREMA